MTTTSAWLSLPYKTNNYW